MKQNNLLQKYIDQRSYNSPMKSIYILMILAVFSSGLLLFYNTTFAQQPMTGIMYFKDGKLDENGNKVYLVDYALMEISGLTIRSEPIDGSKVTITPIEIINDGALKLTDPENPNAYNIIPLKGVSDIKRVEAINGGQLNNYTIDTKSDFTYEIFTETSPTTAVSTYTFDIQAFNKDYFSSNDESEFNNKLEEQLQLAREKIMANSY